MPQKTTAAVGRDVALDYCRAFLTVLVVTHHSVLAYALIGPTVAPRDPRLPWLAGIPIADAHGVIGFDLFAFFNDTFFMSLMFLLSGLFVWPALRRKGWAGFLGGRALRLGVPFVVMALLSPIAYLAAYRVGARHPDAAVFWGQWRSLGVWPAGPGWFIGVLLAFDGLAAVLYRFAPALIEVPGRWASARRPAVLFVVLMSLSALVYLPGRLWFGPGDWTAIGPFSVQTSRAAHYLLYFLAGAAAGAAGGDSGPPMAGQRLAPHWPWWLTAALLLFSAEVTGAAALGPGGALHGLGPTARQLIAGILFVLSCGAISFAMLAVCRRHIAVPNRVLDCLSRDAFGIYVVHYGLVLWLQSALLAVALPATAKAAVVTVTCLTASWAITHAMRRIPWVARVI